MSIYTKRGDKGITDMARTRNISKSDDRIRLSGAIDELNSHIGLMISMISSQETVQFLESVQSTLNLVATGVEDPYNRKCRISEERVTALETEIDNLEKLCPRPVTEKLKGNSSLAAEIDIARTVARRAECSLAQVSVKFGADAGSRNTRGRILFHRFDGRVLAGLGIPEGGEHLIRKLVVVHRDELVAGQKRFRGQPLFNGLGFVELLGQQMTFLPGPCGFVPAPEAPTEIGIADTVAVLADDIFAHIFTSMPFRRSSISACRSLLIGTRLLFFQP